MLAHGQLQRRELGLGYLARERPERAERASKSRKTPTPRGILSASAANSRIGWLAT